MQSKVAGAGMVTMGILIFLYYTAWVFATPLLPSQHYAQAFFLARKWAIIIPAVLLVLFLIFVTAFMGIYSNKKKKTQ